MNLRPCFCHSANLCYICAVIEMPLNGKINPTKLIIEIQLMKRGLLLALTALVVMLARGQVPQFTANNYEGWVYTNPAIELNQNTILANRIVLYTTTTGLQHMLLSPQFACTPGQVIDMHVTWITDQWQDAGFVVSKVALTAALLDANGTSVDSVTFTPVSVNRTNYVDLSITVPKGLRTARLRFASWKADVNSSGAVRQIDMSSSLRGDVNLDNEVNIADVNTLVGVILGNDADADLLRRADVNRDGEVGVGDVNAVIDIILE